MVSKQAERLKTVLIISPYFPPDNTADMHRVRQSVNYYRIFGWNPIVLCVDPTDTEAYKDDTLLETIREDILIYRVRVPSPRITRKIGLGSIALRSLLPMYTKGSELIKSTKPDLIFISTTQFPVMILGRIWRMRYGIPYVLDFQDPWHTEHYKSLPKAQRPPKYWFSYRLNKLLEPGTIRNASGIISVTQAYIDAFHKRYPTTKDQPYTIIPFGASEKDLSSKFDKYIPDFYDKGILNKKKKIVYTGVVNNEMLPIIEMIFRAITEILNNRPDLQHEYAMAFIGTNYGNGDHKQGKLTALIQKYELQSFVFEFEERLGYLSTLQVQKKASILLLCGTTDKDYIASKLAPYMLSGNPILAVYHKNSALSASIESEARIESVFFESKEHLFRLQEEIQEKLNLLLENTSFYAQQEICHPEKYNTEKLSQQQTEFFNKVLSRSNKRYTS